MLFVNNLNNYYMYKIIMHLNMNTTYAGEINMNLKGYLKQFCG